MSTVNKNGDKYYVAVKGAPDELLKRVSNLSDKEKENILLANQKMAQNALRVLGLAYKEVDKPFEEVNSQNIENNLIFAGLVGMIRPRTVRSKSSSCRSKSSRN